MPYYGSNTNFHFQGGMTGQSDGSYERYERDAGSYEPGAMPEMTDQLDQGSDRE